MKNLPTYLMLFAGMALFGSATPLSKLVTEAFPVFVAGGLRVLMAFLILLPFTSFKPLRQFHSKDWWLITGIGVIGVLGFTALLLYGMKQVSGVTGSIIMSATPALTAGLSYLVFGDHFGWRKGTAIGLAVAGILTINIFSKDGGSNHSTFYGMLMVVGAICCEACYTLMGKALTKDFSPVLIACLSALIAFVAFTPVAVWQYESGLFSKATSSDWWTLIAYGVGTMGIGSVMWYNGVQRVEGSTAAAFMGIMPISALLFSYILLGEAFEWIHLLGFGIVFSGVLLIIQAHKKMAS
jgi:drug/metabolite transporter (DMT)-like permease